MSAEEFILIPRSTFIQERPIVEQVLHNPHIASKGKPLALFRSTFIQERPIIEQVLNNPHIASKGKQLALLQRYDTQKFDSLPKPEDVPPPQPLKVTVFDTLVTLTDPQKKKSSFIYDRLESSYRLSLDKDGIILIDNAPTGLTINSFLHTLHQPTKQLEDIYKNILPLLGIQAHLVSNKAAKAILEDVWIAFKTPEGKHPTRRHRTPKK
jgi:hypothetical protein